MKIAFYDTKPYDKTWFKPLAKERGLDVTFFETRLGKDTAILATGNDAVCIFVNDVADKETLDILYEAGVKTILLRCAGYDNVDLKAAEGRFDVMRVPSYSPAAVAEFALTLLMAVNRCVHKAYQRTRDFNFSINGLMGMTLRGKTIGVVGSDAPWWRYFRDSVWRYLPMILIRWKVSRLNTSPRKSFSDAPT